MASTDARPVAQKNVAFRVTFPILDADGDLVTGAASLDSEISKDGGTFADCTNEATEIATASGMYFLDLTSTEMNADTVAIIVKTGTAGAKTTPIVMYPEEAGDFRASVVSGGIVAASFAAGAIDAAAIANGAIDAATFAAGAIDAAAIANGAIDAATFADDAITAAVLAPGAIDAATFAASAIDATAIATGAITAAKFAAGAINAAAIATDAIDADALADGAITAATFAAGAIDATAIATGAIDADALATDAVTEIRSLASGTSDSGTTTTMVDAARTEADTDYWKGALILFTSGDIAGQVRLITAFTPATDTITFSPATTQLVATQNYEILAAGRADVALWLGAAANALVSGRIDASVGAMAADVVTAAAIATDAIGSSELAASAVNEIRDAILSDSTPFVGANIDAAITSRLAPTVAGRTLDVTATGEAGIDLDNTAGTLSAAEIPNLDAAITTRATPTQVNAEVVDALNVDTYAEPAAVPAATVSLAAKIGWLFALARNRILQTSTVQTLKADNGTTDVATAAVSDNGTTFERSEWS